jgi:hypothetical protein
MNRQVALTAQTLGEFATDSGVRAGIRRSTQLFDFLNPALRFVAPAQTVCNYATLLARNAQDNFSISPDGIGTAQRFIVQSAGQTDITLGINAPNSENGPSSAPADAGGVSAINNFLHANPYPNTASPGQHPRECEAGNEPYITGRAVIGNVPGNQGTVTEAQKK